MTSSARIDELQRRYREDPRRYFAALASELRKEGDPQRAIAVCKTELAEAPGHLSGHVVLGQALADIGATDRAAAAFERALELDPENSFAICGLGDLARDAGKLDRAAAWYRRALEVDPRDPAITARLAAADAAPAASDSAPQPELDPYARAMQPPDIALPDGSQAYSTARLPDDDLERQLQEEHAAQTFTAGFFAAVLDGDRRAAASSDDRAPAEAARLPAMPPEAQPASAMAEAPAGDEAHDEARDESGDEADAMDLVAVVEVAAAAGAGDRAEAATADELHLGPPLPEDAGEAAEERDASFPSAEPLPPAEAELLSMDDLILEEPAIVSVAAPTPVPPSSTPLAPAHARPSVEQDVDTLFDELPMVGMDLVNARVEPSDDDAPRGASHGDAPPDAATVDEEPVREVVVDAGTNEGLEATAAPVDREPSEWSQASDGADEADQLRAGEAVGETVSAGGASEEDGDEQDRGHGPSAVPFVTATMAELLWQQGFREEALGVFHQLVSENPADESLRVRLAAVTAQVEAEAMASAPMAEPGSPADQDIPTASEADVAAVPAAGSPAAEGETAVGWLRRLVAVRPQAADSPVGESVPESAAPYTPEAGADDVSDAGPAPDETGASSPPEEIAAGEPALAPAADLLAGAAAAAASALHWEPPAPEAMASMSATPGRGVSTPDDAPDGALTPPSATVVGDEDPLGWGDETAVPAEQGHAAAKSSSGRSADVEAAAGASRNGSGSDAADDAMRAPSGARDLSLDELLGQAVPQRDEMAAGALAAATLALQGDPVLSGQLEAAAAEDPLALDRVLRPSPQSVAALRQGASFSFDQFFQPSPAESSSSTPAFSHGDRATPTEVRSSETRTSTGEDVASKGAGDPDASAREADLEEFHAWLAGLSET